MITRDVAMPTLTALPSPVVNDMPLSALGDLRPSSYDIYTGRRATTQPENVWLDVKVDRPSCGPQQIQEADAVRIALEKLGARGIVRTARDCEVLQGRDFVHDPRHDNEVEKTRITLVLVGLDHLVSIHDGESRGIQRAHEKLTSEGLNQHPLNIARLVLEESLAALPQIEFEFDRCVSPLLRKVSHELLSDTEYEKLTSIYQSVEYIRRRVSMMKSGVARSASLSLTKVDRHIQETIGPGLESLLEQFNSHEDTCKQISDAIEWTWQRHSDRLKKRSIEEQEEANRIQAKAEERKQASDARWQILGGISVPLGLGLALIQSFHLTAPVGLGVMAAASVLSAALVYFRSDDFSWLYPTRTDRWDRFMKELKDIFGQRA
jgi:hypothetical protein